MLLQTHNLKEQSTKVYEIRISAENISSLPHKSYNKLLHQDILMCVSSKRSLHDHISHAQCALFTAQFAVHTVCEVKICFAEPCLNLDGEAVLGHVE